MSEIPTKYLNFIYPNKTTDKPIPTTTEEIDVVYSLPNLPDLYDKWKSYPIFKWKWNPEKPNEVIAKDDIIPNHQTWITWGPYQMIWRNPFDPYKLGRNVKGIQTGQKYIEVLHKMGDITDGNWFNVAPGSGMFFDLTDSKILVTRNKLSAILTLLKENDPDNVKSNDEAADIIVEKYGDDFSWTGWQGIGSDFETEPSVTGNITITIVLLITLLITIAIISLKLLKVIPTNITVITTIIAITITVTMLFWNTKEKYSWTTSYGQQKVYIEKTFGVKTLKDLLLIAADNNDPDKTALEWVGNCPWMTDNWSYNIAKKLGYNMIQFVCAPYNGFWSNEFVWIEDNITINELIEQRVSTTLKTCTNDSEVVLACQFNNNENPDRSYLKVKSPILVNKWIQYLAIGLTIATILIVLVIYHHFKRK